MIGRCDMATHMTMTDIPYDVLSQIRESKKPSHDDLKETVQKMKYQILAKESYKNGK